MYEFQSSTVSPMLHPGSNPKISAYKTPNCLYSGCCNKTKTFSGVPYTLLILPSMSMLNIVCSAFTFT